MPVHSLAHSAFQKFSPSVVEDGWPLIACVCVLVSSDFIWCHLKLLCPQQGNGIVKALRAGDPVKSLLTTVSVYYSFGQLKMCFLKLTYEIV